MSIQIIGPFESADQLADQAAADLGLKLVELLGKQSVVHLVLTGGSVGIKTLEYLGPRLASVDLSNLELWWGDERFLENSSPDRNFVQADHYLLSKINIPKENLHPIPATDSGTLEQAARIFEKHITEVSPAFDIVLLGMGPDGHIASLFPGSAPQAIGTLVVAEANSPKPPAQRISLSYEALSSANELWFLVAGSDKSTAVKQVLNEHRLPASMVSGRNTTRWYLDNDAAKGITS